VPTRKLHLTSQGKCKKMDRWQRNDGKARGEEGKRDGEEIWANGLSSPNRNFWLRHRFPILIMTNLVAAFPRLIYAFSLIGIVYDWSSGLSSVLATGRIGRAALAEWVQRSGWKGWLSDHKTRCARSEQKKRLGTP